MLNRLTNKVDLYPVPLKFLKNKYAQYGLSSKKIIVKKYDLRKHSQLENVTIAKGEIVKGYME